MRHGTPEHMRGLRDRLELGLLQHADGVNGGGLHGSPTPRTFGLMVSMEKLW